MLDVSANGTRSKLLNIDFNPTFQHAATGLSSEVQFNIDNFIQPVRSTQIKKMLATQISATNMSSSSVKYDGNKIMLNIIGNPDLEGIDTDVAQE